MGPSRCSLSPVRVRKKILPRCSKVHMVAVVSVVPLGICDVSSLSQSQIRVLPEVHGVMEAMVKKKKIEIYVPGLRVF